MHEDLPDGFYEMLLATAPPPDLRVMPRPESQIDDVSEEVIPESPLDEPGPTGRDSEAEDDVDDIDNLDNDTQSISSSLTAYQGFLLSN